MKEETPAVNGQDIMVSLDIKLQDTVEQALAEGVKDLETEEGSVHRHGCRPPARFTPRARCPT